MPVFKVKMKVEAVVWAEDRTEAMKRGHSALTEEIGNYDWYDVRVSEVGSLEDLPDRWDGDTLIYHGGNGDLPAQEALDRADEERLADAEEEDDDEIWAP